MNAANVACVRAVERFHRSRFGVRIAEESTTLEAEPCDNGTLKTEDAGSVVSQRARARRAGVRSVLAKQLGQRGERELPASSKERRTSPGGSR
jgi:hypothetical protein